MVEPEQGVIYRKEDFADDEWSLLCSVTRNKFGDAGLMVWWYKSGNEYWSAMTKYSSLEATTSFVLARTMTREDRASRVEAPQDDEVQRTAKVLAHMDGLPAWVWDALKPEAKAKYVAKARESIKAVS